MSANGTFSTTLDYEFVGGGYLNIVGGVNVNLDPVFNSTSKVYVVGESSNNFISFDFSSAAQMPPARGVLEQTIPFTFSATAEFGIQSWAEANTRIEFTFSPMVGYNLTHGRLDQTIPFNLTFTADQFSLGDGSVSYDFILNGEGINRSTHTYDMMGLNGVSFRDNFNGVTLINYITETRIVNESNGVRILPPA